MGNCSLMGSTSLTAISSPALAPCACSAGFFMVPKGPPVLVATSKVPAECQLREKSKEVAVSGFPNRIRQFHSTTTRRRRIRLTLGGAWAGRSSSQRWGRGAFAWPCRPPWGSPRSPWGRPSPWLLTSRSALLATGDRGGEGEWKGMDRQQARTPLYI